MKTMCYPGYHHNSFVATYVLGHIMYCYTLLVPMKERVLNKLNKECNISGYCDKISTLFVISTLF